MSNATATETTTRTPSLATRQAKWKRDYRRAADATENARVLRDTAVVNYFRSLPDSETVTKKTANGEQRTTKPVSDNARAKSTLVALAVSVDDKGRTQDIFGLTPQRVTQIVKAYHRAETITQTSTTVGALASVLETEEANALTVALTEAAKSINLGDKGADALAETIRADLADVTPADAVKAAEAITRESIVKARAAKAAAPEVKPESDGERPVVKISAALDALESALSGAADLDPQQKTLLLQRLETLAKHLS